MLQLTNSNAEQTFATHNSINMNPQVYAEWNYNAFTKPYNVFPNGSSASEIFTATSDFTVTSGAGNITAGSTVFPSSGTVRSASSSYTTDVRTSTKSLRLGTSLDGILSPTTFTSSSISVSTGFYKLTFYVKADLNKSTGTVQRIPSSDLTLSTQGTGNIYYFQVVPVDENGKKPSFATDSTSTTLASDTASGRYAATASPTITFPTQESAVEYDIYVSDTKDLPKFYQTVSRSYSDDVSKTKTLTASFNRDTGLSAVPSDIVKRAQRGNQISVTTLVDLFNGADKISDTSFYVKFYDDENSVSTNNVGSFVLNGVTYNKVEVYFGSKTTFDKFKINFCLNSLRDESIIFIDKFELVKIDDWVFDSKDFYPIENVFRQTLLGESLLNPLYTNNKMKDKSYKPVSYGYYNPDGVVVSSPQKNISTSIYNVFKYYVSKIENAGSHTVTAKYDSLLTMNKIVLKASSALTSVTGGTVKLFNAAGTQIGSDITVPSWGGKEYMIMTYDGSSWSNSSTFSPPQLTDSGIMKNCVGNVASIVVTLNFSKSISNVDYIASRLHLIEVSPRLEIDLSPLIKGFSVDKSIDNENSANGFPIGYINANTGQVEISNIPVYNAGLPYTIFSEISERSTFKDLLREGVKFSINLVSPQQDFTGVVPVCVMYANKWSLGGIERVTVDLFDSVKYNLMSIQSPQYSGMHESSFDTISNIFAICGFSDYDYDLLKDILDSSARNTTYFWTDIEVPIFQSIQSFFVSHQIGAWIDEYGSLQFKNLNSIVNDYVKRSFSVNFAVTDKSLSNIGTSSITYIPNLFSDGFSYEISPKPGKIIINYKVPTVSLNAANVTGVGLTAAVQFKEAPKQIWEPQGFSQVILTYLDKGVQYENELYLDKAMINRAAYSFGNYSGQAFLGGEAVGWKGIEYQFYGNIAKNPYKTAIVNEAEIQSVIDQLRNENDSEDVFNYQTTGRMLNVERGKYGTQVQKHPMFLGPQKTNIPAGFTDASTEFGFKYASNTSSLADGVSVFKQDQAGTSGTPIKSTSLNLICDKTNKKAAIAYLKNFDPTGCNFYSFTFKFDKSFDVKKDRESGIFLNFTQSATTQTTPLYVGIRYQKDKNATIVLSDSTIGSSSWRINDKTTALSTNIKISPETLYRFSFWISANGQVTFFLNEKNIGSCKITNSSSILDPYKIKSFGAYHLHQTTATNSIVVKEMYASQWKTAGSLFSDTNFIKEITSRSIKYHFQSKDILDNIVNNIPITNKYYLWESRITLRGIEVFDNVDLGYKPMVPGTSFVRRSNYDPDGTYVAVYGQPPVVAVNPDFNKVVANDVAYSTAITSPFKISMVAVNNSKDQLVYLQTPDKKIGEVSIRGLAVFGKTQVLSTDKRSEKIINSRNLKDVLQIDSAWIQSEEDAENLSNYVKILTNTFNSTFTVKIYGNPLIQVGDFCQILYSLREIGYNHEKGVVPRYCFVKSVKHNYADGFSTDLVLKPMFEMN